jgi:hypothetical protein
MFNPQKCKQFFLDQLELKVLKHVILGYFAQFKQLFLKNREQMIRNFANKLLI